MSLSYADNLNIQMQKQNVERDSFLTLAAMKAYPETSLPDIFTATCKETGKLYIYNKDNEVDETTGKWRELNGAPDAIEASSIIMADRSNLETKISELVSNESLSSVATSGNYNDLNNVPENLTDFTNDAGYITSEDLPDLSSYYTKTQIDATVSTLEGKIASAGSGGSGSGSSGGGIPGNFDANVQIWTGSGEDYNNLGIYDSQTIYFITNPITEEEE